MTDAATWIKSTDRLPDYGIPVWVVYHGVVQYVAYVRDIGCGDGTRSEWRAANDDDSDSMPESFVSHWMPIPEAPRDSHT